MHWIETSKCENVQIIKYVNAFVNQKLEKINMIYKLYLSRSFRWINYLLCLLKKVNIDKMYLLHSISYWNILRKMFCLK